jgi:ankyrin repeat protein
MDTEPKAKDCILMTRGPDRCFPLYWAVESGSLSILCQILRLEAKVGQRTAKNWTALHCAADSNRLDLAEELLISSQSVVDVTTDLLETPLHLAANAAMVRWKVRALRPPP